MPIKAGCCGTISIYLWDGLNCETTRIGPPPFLPHPCWVDQCGRFNFSSKATISKMIFFLHIIYTCRPSFAGVSSPDLDPLQTRLYHRLLPLSEWRKKQMNNTETRSRSTKLQFMSLVTPISFYNRFGTNSSAALPINVRSACVQMAAASNTTS